MNALELVNREALLRPIFAGWTEAPSSATFGLNPSKVNSRVPSTDEVIKFLGGLHYELGNQGIEVKDKWECSERALWGVVHARHRFPGIAIGVAEGISQVGEIAGKNHAVIIIWEKGLSGYRYFDPLYRDPYRFDSEPLKISRIIAFPFGSEGQYDTILPIRNLNTSRMKSNSYVSYKENYWLYPKERIMDYLNKQIYETKCIDLIDHQWISGESYREYWLFEDRAFWAYIHARREFEGCAIGIAYGDPATGKSTAANVIWYREDKAIKRLYWDPSPEMRKDVTNSFRPRILLF